MIVTHKLSPMDLTTRGVTQRIDAVQDDKYSRNVEFTLTQNGMAWPIPDGARAIIRYKKSDGTGGNYDVLPDGSTAYTIKGNVLTVALAPQVCTASGSVALAVGLILGEAEINTFAVNICVHDNPGINVLSEDYINVHFISRLEYLERAVEDLMYVPIQITSIRCSPSVVEMGRVIDEVALAWQTNKAPTVLILDDTQVDSGATTIRLTGLRLTSSKNWKLMAVDERSAKSTVTAGISFHNGVYYGVASDPETIDSAFILKFDKALSSAKITKFTVTARAGEYIWYSVPSRFGPCKFTVGGFDGGFYRVAVIDFTNASGYTESYDIYKSANAGLGSTTVGVS